VKRAAPALILTLLVLGAPACTSPANVHGPSSVSELLDLSVERVVSAIEHLAERRVIGHIPTPLLGCTRWFDLDHDGVTTRVHYPACVLPDTVVECPGTEVTVVGYAVGPVWIEATAILGKSRVKGRCPR
jgi:hypothetical protein